MYIYIKAQVQLGLIPNWCLWPRKRESLVDKGEFNVPKKDAHLKSTCLDQKKKKKVVFFKKKKKEYSRGGEEGKRDGDKS